MSLTQIDPKEIRRLWILKLIAEHGTIKRAALATQLTSSAVSQALSSMESSLNRRLVVRQGEKFVLTPYGQGLVQAASPALLALEELHKYLNPKTEPLPKMTSLTIGTTQSLAIDVLPGLVERLRRKYPGIRIHLKVGRSSALSTAVRKGELSMAVVAENEEMEGLSVIPVAEESMGFYCSSRPEFAKLGWALVEKLGVGAFPPDHGGYAPYFRKLFKPFGPGWKPALLSESYEALRALAVNGSMVTVLSTRVAAIAHGELFELENPALKGLPASDKNRPGSYKISLISDRSLDPKQGELLAQELREIMHA
jgi:DNA-binding transcriptional LysR family regulator